MKYCRLLCLSLLVAAKAGTLMAQSARVDSSDAVPCDSVGVPSDSVRALTDTIRSQADSIAWNSELEGVVVKAQRQLIKQDIDRIGYDVQADEDSKTQTVMDMLRKVPMVTVDGEDNILVKGNSNFKVYKNGHLDPSLTKNAKEVLKSMPASMVKRIEVITDPGAREDAEGVDAILNLVMVDGSKLGGVTGVVNLSYNTLNYPNFYTSLTSQMGKLLISGNYGYGGMSSKETENSYDASAIYLSTANRLHTHSDGSNPGAIHYADLNASYDIDSLNLLSASFGGYFYTLNVQGSGQNLLSDPTGQPLYSYTNRYWMPGYSHQSWNGRLDYEHKTHRQGERLTLSYMLALTRQHTDQESTYEDMVDAPFSYTGSLLTARERFTEHTFQLDWLRPLGKGHQIEVGSKYIDRSNSSRNLQEFYGLAPQPETMFDHVTRVWAAYVDYIYRKDKWSARAGLRYEHSRMEAEEASGSSGVGDGQTATAVSDATSVRWNPVGTFRLNDWVPQASLKYQLTDAQSLKLSYTTSINRPGISYLNPTVVTSPSVVRQGNPGLVSSHTQSLGLTYMYVGRRLTLQLTPSYSMLRNGIAMVQTAHDDVRYQTYDNVERYRRLSFGQYVQWRPWEGTTLVMNNTLRYVHYGNPNLSYRNFSWSDNYYANLTQRMPWRLQLSVSVYGMMGHSASSIYHTSHSYFRCFASLQRSFLKEDRLTVRLSVNNPFRRFVEYGEETVNGDFRDFSVSKSRGRSAQLSVMWRFGSLKASVKKAEHSIENDDVVGGISKK